MQPTTREWVDKAEGDANVVAALWQMESPVYDAMCLHAQQCEVVSGMSLWVLR